MIPRKPVFKQPDEENAYRLLERLWCHYNVILATTESQLWRAFAKGHIEKVDHAKVLFVAAFVEVRRLQN